MQGITLTGKFAAILGISAYLLNSVISALSGLSVFVLFTMVLLLSTVTLRMILRQVLIHAYQKDSTRTRILVYGASQTGEQLAMALQSDESLQLVAFIDENPTLQSLMIAGSPVYSPLKLAELVKTESIDRIVLCLPSSQIEQARLAYKLRTLGCEVHSLPSFATLLSTGSIGSKGAPLRLNELLGRGHLSHALPKVTDSYTGKRVLITGAGGSIGSELCRQIAGCNPESLVLLDHSELALYTIHKELIDLPSTIKIEPVLGSITDKSLINHTLRQHKIDIVLHAAAYKHLPLVEDNAIAGLANNVLGTRIVAEAARAAGVERVTLISTDKAVRPVSIMGASKRLAELVFQDLASRSETTRFSIVRFGNVLDSSGSVIPPVGGGRFRGSRRPPPAGAHGPVADRPAEGAARVPRDETELGHRRHALAQAVGGQRLAPRREGEVEERLDLPRVLRRLPRYPVQEPAPPPRKRRRA